jgi:dienelactone hydrolase
VSSGIATREVTIPPHGLAGMLRLPADATCLVVFAHGSGSSRFSPRNNAVAEGFAAHGIATLLFDLLTPAEEDDRANVFDIPLLAERLADAVAWARREPSLSKLPLGVFGASTGVAAALVVAARLADAVGAVVSRGGRPDLADDALEAVRAPTLLIVGGADYGVIGLNEAAAARMTAPKALEIVPGATHLFPEPGALEAVIALAGGWFLQHLAGKHGAGDEDTGTRRRFSPTLLLLQRDDVGDDGLDLVLAEKIERHLRHAGVHRREDDAGINLLRRPEPGDRGEARRILLGDTLRRHVMAERAMFGRELAAPDDIALGKSWRRERGDEGQAQR